MKNLKFCVLTVLVVLFAVSGAFAAPFTSEKGGFSIELPKSWDPMPKEQLDAMAAGGTYLVAMDQAALQTGKMLSLTVLKVPSPDAALTTQSITSFQADQMKAIPGVKDIKSELKNVGGTEWAALSYTLEANGMTTAFVQYSAVKDGTLTSLLFSFDKPSGYESLIESTVASYKAK
ncbi:hypothetical protein AGMMS49957_09670 [Synergistales bacterium]|nr:hypothetical protein AGMMS49957_09670 [Synergistales bacterium]